MTALLGEQLFILCAIMAIGASLGRLSWRGWSLGNSAVFFVGLAFGHFGFTIPKPIVDLGLVLFLYATGLQAGPRFFRSFQKQGGQVVVVAGAVVVAAALMTLALTKLMNLPYALAAGIFTGAVTSTPALAGAVEAVSRFDPGQASTVSVGYGIVFPLALIAVPLAIQLAPTLLRRDLAAADAEWLEKQAAERSPLAKLQFRVTNPNVRRPAHCGPERAPSHPGQHLARPSVKPGRRGGRGWARRGAARGRCGPGSRRARGVGEAALADRRLRGGADGAERPRRKP